VTPSLETALRDARDLLGGDGIPWAVAGGWALDLFLGRETREHADVDLAIWRADQQRLHAAASPDWVLEVADNGALRQWNAGEWLSLPLHEIHAHRGSGVGGSLELLLNERDDSAWIFRRDAAVRRELDRAIVSREGIAFLAPEIVLLYKSKAPRLTDDMDFRAALPALTNERRAWLHGAIARWSVRHPWVMELGATGAD
jgi:hypothetical protein